MPELETCNQTSQHKLSQNPVPTPAQAQFSLPVSLRLLDLEGSPENLGHFQVGSYCYRSYNYRRSIYLIEALWKPYITLNSPHAVSCKKTLLRKNGIISQLTRVLVGLYEEQASRALKRTKTSGLCRFSSRLLGSGRFMGSYKWGYKSLNMAFKYSYPTYKPIYNYP